MEKFIMIVLNMYADNSVSNALITQPKDHSSKYDLRSVKTHTIAIKELLAYLDSLNNSLLVCCYVIPTSIYDSSSKWQIPNIYNIQLYQ